MRATFELNHLSGPMPGPAPTRAPLALHRVLPGHRATPLIDAPRLAGELNLGRVWLKDETERLGLPSFKAMGASWAAIRALSALAEEDLAALGSLEAIAERVARLRPLTLAAATDGNHGRALARIAAMLGLDARIFVPAGMAPARIEAIAGEGAEVVRVDGSYDDAVARSATAAGPGCLVVSDTSWPGYETIPHDAIDGYSTILWEIADELEGRGEAWPQLVLVQLGVGAFGAAVIRHVRHEHGQSSRIVGVEPLGADCVRASLAAGRVVTTQTTGTIMSGLDAGTPSAVAWPYVAAGLDALLAIDDSVAVDGIRRLASVGVIAGECAGAAVGALAHLASDPSAREALSIDGNTNVLLFLTEGATDRAAIDRILAGAKEQPA